MTTLMDSTALRATGRPAGSPPGPAAGMSIYNPAHPDRWTRPYEASSWRSASITDRRRWASRFRDLLIRNSEAVLAAVEADVFKPRWEGLTSDLLPLLAACRWHEKRAGKILKPARIRPGVWWSLGQSHRIERHPAGLIGIIATWNYPVQLLGIQLVQALVAGNDVVVKPSERAPRSQELLLLFAQQAGLPAGCLRVLPSTREAGREMLSNEPLDHLLFTGSTSVGREIAAIASAKLLPTTLELSGRDSAIVLKDADLSLAARTIWNAVCMNAGQTCMAPRRVLVERDAYSGFLAQLAPLAAGARPRRLIDCAAARFCFDLASDALAAGARSLSGVFEAPWDERLVPLAIVDCPPTAPLMLGEHFGPVLAVTAVANASAAVDLHHRTAQQHALATSIFTNCRSSARRAAADVGSGIVTINDCVVPTGDPCVSIRARNSSGWGVSRGEAGLLAMTRAVHTSITSRWLRLPTDAPTTAAAAKIGRFMLGRASSPH